MTKSASKLVALHTLRDGGAGRAWAARDRRAEPPSLKLRRARSAFGRATAARGGLIRAS